MKRKQKISAFYRTWRYITVFKTAALVLLLSHKSPVYKLASYISMIYFNIFFISETRTSRWFLSQLRLPHQKPCMISNSSVSYVCYMYCLYHRLHYHNHKCTTTKQLLQILRLISFTNFNAQFLYSLTICMLHYNPRHVSRINMPSMPDDSRLQSSLLSSGILYSRLQRVTIPDAVIIQFDLLKMGMLMLETCRGL